MNTRTSNNWQSKPGGWDALNLSMLDFYGDYPLLNSNDLQPFANISPCHDNKKILTGTFIHTFVDDHLQERFWNDPVKYAKRFKNCSNVMSPDYSLLIGMPKPLQMFNVYRNRFVGWVWQQSGINVIPTIAWSDSDSFEYCFEGVKVGSCVAVSNIGCMNEKHKSFFDAGYSEMIRRLSPKKIIFMCKKSLRNEYAGENIIFIDSHFDKKRNLWAEEAGKV